MVVVPAAFVHLPTAVVVVVVGVVPVGAGVGWALPGAGTPDVAAAFVAPVAFGPDVTFAGRCGANFNAERRRFVADEDVDLGEGWCGEGGECKATSEQFQFPR
jgi:hypothetical protein